MQLARVRGNVVATVKAPGLSAHKLLIVEAVSAGSPLSSIDDSELGQTVYVAVDLAGAGVGEIVLVTFGSAARVETQGQTAPTDAAIVGIVDSVQIESRETFVKS